MERTQLKIWKWSKDKLITFHIQAYGQNISNARHALYFIM